jgi:hypothetical protein
LAEEYRKYAKRVNATRVATEKDEPPPKLRSECFTNFSQKRPRYADGWITKFPKLAECRISRKNRKTQNPTRNSVGRCTKVKGKYVAEGVLRQLLRDMYMEVSSTLAAGCEKEAFGEG